MAGEALLVLIQQRTHYHAPSCADGNSLLLIMMRRDMAANIVISKSVDGGLTWTRTVLFTAPAGCAYATGAVPVLEAQNFLWRGFEQWCSALAWPFSFKVIMASRLASDRAQTICTSNPVNHVYPQALMVSISTTDDLMDPASWRISPERQFSSDWIPGWWPPTVTRGGYLEGNAIHNPVDDAVYLMLRCPVIDSGNGALHDINHACLFRYDEHIDRNNTSKKLPRRRPWCVERCSHWADCLQAWCAWQGIQLSLTILLSHCSPLSREVTVTEFGNKDDHIDATPPPFQEPPAPSNQDPRTEGHLTWRGVINMPGGGNKVRGTILLKYTAASLGGATLLQQHDVPC